MKGAIHVSLLVWLLSTDILKCRLLPNLSCVIKKIILLLSLPARKKTIPQGFCSEESHPAEKLVGGARGKAEWGELAPRSQSNPLILEKMKMRLKEGKDLPKDTQCILAELESESQFPASQETLSTASWEEKRRKTD